MARQLRVNDVGFYHVINLGVEQRNIFLRMMTVKSLSKLLMKAL